MNKIYELKALRLYTFCWNTASDFQLVKIGLVSRIQNYIINNCIFDTGLKDLPSEVQFNLLLVQNNLGCMWYSTISKWRNLLIFLVPFSKHQKHGKTTFCSVLLYDKISKWYNRFLAFFGKFCPKIPALEMVKFLWRIFDRAFRVQQSYYYQFFKEKSIWCQTLSDF